MIRYLCAFFIAIFIMIQVDAADKKGKTVAEFDTAEAEKIMESVKIPVVKDDWKRPECRDGIIYKNGRPDFILSANLGRNTLFSRNVRKRRLAGEPEWVRDSIFHNRDFDRNVTDALGLDAVNVDLERGLCGVDSFSELGNSLSKRLRRFYGVYLRDGKLVPMNKGREMNIGVWQKRLPALDGLPIIAETAYEFNFGEKHMKYTRHAGLPDNASCHMNSSAIGGEFPFSHSNAIGRKITENMVKSSARFTLACGANPWIYMFAREIHDYVDMSKENREEFGKYLAEKYGDIDKLNAEWGLSGNVAYKDFAQVANSGIVFDKNKRGLWIEWRRFGGQKFRKTIDSLKVAIHQVDQRPDTYLSFMNNVWTAKNDYDTVVDMRQAMKACDLYFTEGGAIFGDYPDLTDRKVDDITAILWANRFYAAQLFADQARAISPDKPVFNIEFYNFRWSNGQQVPVRSVDVVTNLWSETIHGVSGANLFTWQRWGSLEQEKNGSGMASYSLLNPYMYGRDFFEAPKRFKSEINAVGDILLPRPRIKGKVAFLWSKASRWNREAGYFENFMPNYIAMTSTNCPFDLLYEDNLSEGKGAQYEAIIIPAGQFLFKDALPALKQYVENGGVLVVFGGAMRFDEYGKPLGADDLLGVKRASTAKKNENKINFGKQFCTSDITAKSFTDFESKTAEVAAVCANGNTPAMSVNKVGKGKVVYIGAENFPLVSLYELYGRMLPWINVKQPYKLVDAKTSKSRINIEMQVIDRGDKRLIYMVNWDNFKPHLMKLWDENPMKDGSCVYDLAGKRQILSPSGNLKWTEDELRKGVPCPLPGQTRHILIMTQNPFDDKAATVAVKTVEAEYPAIVANDKRQNEDCKRYAGEVRRKVELLKDELCRDRIKKRKSFKVATDKCFSINLRDAVNMPFSGAGAPSDLSGIPVGYQNFLGVPFDIIDPFFNYGHSCLVLMGNNKKDLPTAAKNITVGNNVGKLFFLHTAAWCGKGAPVLIYNIHYADGSSQRLVMTGGCEIGDWYKVEDYETSDCQIAWEKCVESGRKLFNGVFAYEWSNTKPEVQIKSIDIKSSGNAVPTVIAITAEMP